MSFVVEVDVRVAVDGVVTVQGGFVDGRQRGFELGGGGGLLDVVRPCLVGWHHIC